MASILRSVRNTERLAKITLVLVRHGFGEIVSRLPLGPLKGAPPAPGEPGRFAVRLREVLQDLGPSFVKLGQVMSTRGDLLPPDVVAELQKLQDEVPPMSAEEVDEVLAEAYGGDLDHVFAELSREPLASASIGQVHAARLRGEGDAEGAEVVVKLQRPGARTTVERDLDLLYMFARLVAEYVPESRVYQPVALVAEFDRAITAELDYGLEADNALRFARNFQSDASVRFPVPYREVSGKRTLVMERFRGQHIDDFVAAGGPGTGPRIAKRALRVVAKMIFEDGFFHADPHPGNIIMLGTPDEPVLGLIDLGLVGRLSEDMRDKAISLMLAAVTNDVDGLAEALLGMGRARGRVDMARFKADVVRISEKYLGRSLKDVELSGLVRDMVQGAVEHDIEMPADMMMVGKALMTVEGIGKQLDPDLDVVEELRPYLTEIVMQRYSPQRIGRDLLRHARQLGGMLQTLPRQVHDVLEDLRSGRLAVETRDPARTTTVDRLGRRLFSAIIAAALIAAGTALLIARPERSLGTWMLVIATVIVGIHVVADWRRAKAAARRR
ncbi:MAG: AarF/ABC1/UbiB kinase family protein [Deltaproteobacteria bacterium]|nr:AarF/ABC1/UbiB kinase family protein [Deltaproteobacteria bacterium]